jgi:hypothetical protein
MIEGNDYVKNIVKRYFFENKSKGHFNVIRRG